MIDHFKRIQWRLMNLKNHSSIRRVPRSFQNIKVGDYSYGPIDILTSSKMPRLTIGSFCSIAEGVTFVIQNGHPLNHLSTFPFKVVALKKSTVEAVGKGGITVEDDVWIGFGCTILDGVTLRRGTVVAAGAVVAKDTPPYSVVGGVPAKVIKYRFDQNTIKNLLNIDFARLTRSEIEAHIDSLYQPLNCDDLHDEFSFLLK